MGKNIRYTFLSTCVTLLMCMFSANAQKVAFKSNVPYWATGVSPNAALELSLGKKTTLELGGDFNLWTFKNNKKVKHWLAQPELHYWFCESFNGHFIGIHAHGTQYNVGGWDIPVGRLKAFKEHRYEGYLYGAGLSYSYQIEGGNNRAAIDRLNRIESAPRAWNNLRVAYVRLGDTAKAREYFEKSASRGDEDAKHNLEELERTMEN